MRSGFFSLFSISFRPEWYSHAPSGILRFFRRVVVLLIDERAGVGDQAAKQVGTKPAHGERRGAAGAAAHHGLSPGILGEGDASDTRL